LTLEEESVIDELPEILSPKVDVIFKALFGNENNAAILADFLTAILGLNDGDITGDDITIVDSQKNRRHINDKLIILDVKLKLKKDKVIDIEMQVEPIKGMGNRIMFYLAEMLTCQLDKGGDYEKLTPVVSVAIVDYLFFKHNADYHNEFRMMEKNRHFEFSGLMSVHTLELPKLPPDTDGKLENWLKFLKSEKKEDFMAVAEKSPIINEALEKLISVSAKDDMRELYKARIKAQRDERGRIAYGFDSGYDKGKTEGILQGMEKGMLQGMRERANEIARNMIAMEIDADTIAKATGLFIDDVLRLQSE